MKGNRRVSSLDGLRGVAVLAVVGVHLGIPIARGGGYGVDIFFVLSGFLITRLLLTELADTGRISRRNFYARRALRLFPALAVTVCLSVLLDLTAKRGGHHMATAVPAVILYVSNWVVSFNSQALGFLGQTWSLAIEEQFYLFWPLLLMVPRVRATMTRWLPWAITASAAGRTVLHITWSGRVDIWTPFRADGLLLGALVAVHAQRGTLPRWLGYPAVPPACAAIAAPLLLRNIDSSYSEIGMTVIALCTAALISHLTLSSGTVNYLLSLRPLATVGKVSYGVYLYHYGIILWLFAAGYSRAFVWPVALACTVALTALSWFIVERPALRMKTLFEHPHRDQSFSSDIAGRTPPLAPDRIEPPPTGDQAAGDLS